MSVFKGAVKGMYKGPCTFCGDYIETWVSQADLGGKKAAWCGKPVCRQKAGLWLVKQLAGAAKRLPLHKLDARAEVSKHDSRISVTQE
jgi:hypothetical protein